jgi:hypothetical protein
MQQLTDGVRVLGRSWAWLWAFECEDALEIHQSKRCDFCSRAAEWVSNLFSPCLLSSVNKTPATLTGGVLGFS